VSPTKIQLTGLTAQLLILTMAATEISQREVDKAKALTNAPVSVEYDKMISGMLYV
jgi:hypothetical protein